MSQLKFTSMNLYGFQKEFGSHLCAKQPSVHCIKRPLPCQLFTFFSSSFVHPHFLSRRWKEEFKTTKKRSNATHKNPGTLYFEMMQVLKRPIAYTHGVLSYLVFRFCGKRKNHVCSTPDKAKSTAIAVFFGVYCSFYTYLHHDVSKFKLT